MNRRQAGRLGGLTRALDPEAAAAARRGFDARFYRMVDPDNELPEAERERRAMIARKLHFTRMGIKSAEKRKRRAA